MNLNAGRTIDVTLRTIPYMARRALFFGFLLAAALVHIIVLAVIARTFGYAAFWALFISSLFFAAWIIVKTPLFSYGPLHALHVGHLSLIAGFIVDDEGPAGVSQVPWADSRLRERFQDALEMAEVDAFLEKAIACFHEKRFASPALLARPAQRLVHDAIMAHVLQNEGESAWEAARKGVALYAKSSRLFVMPALIIAAVNLGATALAPLVFMVPLGLVALMVPIEWLFFRFVLCYVAVLLGLAAKVILFDPLAAAAMFLLFHQEIDGQDVDSETAAWLEYENPAYREMATRAKGSSA